MKITTSINGVTKVTSYGNKVFYRYSSEAQFAQYRRVFYRDSPQANYVQIYQYDNTKPVITVTSATGYISSSTYTLTGKVYDEHSGIRTFTIDNVATSVGSDGSFSRTFSVSGSRTFVLKAVDNAGNEFSTSVIVTYDASPHDMPLSDYIIANISTDHAHDHSNGRDWSNTGTIYPYYILSDTTGTYTGEGLWAKAEAWYSATIILSRFPNYTSIKKLVIALYGYGEQTITITPGQTTVNFSDYSEFDTSNSYFPHGLGERWGVDTKAGISDIKYYYS